MTAPAADSRAAHVNPTVAALGDHAAGGISPRRPDAAVRVCLDDAPTPAEGP